MSFSSRFLKRTAVVVAPIPAYLLWRQAWIQFSPSVESKPGHFEKPGHVLRLTVSYHLAVPAYQGFILFSDPKLLNISTPDWFNIEICANSTGVWGNFVRASRLCNYDWWYEQRDAEMQLEEARIQEEHHAQFSSLNVLERKSSRGKSTSPLIETPVNPQRLFRQHCERRLESLEDCEPAAWRDYLVFPTYISYWITFHSIFGPMLWTSQILLGGKCLNPTFLSSVDHSHDNANHWLDQHKVKHALNPAASERQRLRGEEEAREAAQCELRYEDKPFLYRLWCTPSIQAVSGFITPLLPKTDFQYYYRMMYRQLAGPYRLFEHSHLIIRQHVLTSKDFAFKEDRPVVQKTDDFDDDDASNDLPECLLRGESALKTTDKLKLSDEQSNEFSRLEDTVVFSVFGEPIANYICLLWLKGLLRARYCYFRKEYGGRMIGETVSWG